MFLLDNKIMLHRHVVFVCYKNDVEDTKTLCGKNVQYLMLTLAVYILTTGL